MNLLVIGIDIGGTNTDFAVVDTKGNILSKKSLRTDSYDNVDDYVRALSTGIKEIIAGKESHLKGIGIGAPSANYYKGTIENAPNLKWKGIIPFAEKINIELGMPAYITNDANAAAIGEKLYGSAKGMNDFLVITLGTGLGSGFVTGGNILYGHTGFAGELGHTIIIPDGRECGCGRRGCLETYVSATGITATASELLRQSQDESLLRQIKPGTLSSKLIYEAALKHDSIALKSFDITGDLLGRRLADTVAITSPEAIILFGGLANAGDYIFKPTEYSLNLNLLNNFKGSVKLIRSGIDENNAAVLGAAALAFHELKLSVL